MQASKAAKAPIIEVEDILIRKREPGVVRRAVAPRDSKAAIVKGYVVTSTVGILREVNEPVTSVLVDTPARVLAVRGSRGRLELGGSVGECQGCAVAYYRLVAMAVILCVGQ